MSVRRDRRVPATVNGARRAKQGQTTAARSYINIDSGSSELLDVGAWLMRASARPKTETWFEWVVTSLTTCKGDEGAPHPSRLGTHQRNAMVSCSQYKMKVSADLFWSSQTVWTFSVWYIVERICLFSLWSWFQHWRHLEAEHPRGHAAARLERLPASHGSSCCKYWTHQETIEYLFTSRLHAHKQEKNAFFFLRAAHIMKNKKDGAKLCIIVQSRVVPALCGELREGSGMWEVK